MHIPDAFIPIPQGAIYWLVALMFIALALRWARNEMSEEKIPLIAVLAAGIFALQSFNLPVSMGTSGHLVGGALAAIILGSPFAAVFILTLVLIVQGVLFGDGGITTMGANIINMGVIGGFVGFYTFKGLMAATKNVNIAAFAAAWLACVIPALACAVEMYFAGTFPLTQGLIAMGVYHALIGFIEGFVTVVAVRLIVAARPDIVDFTLEAPVVAGGVITMDNKTFIIIGIAVALLIGVVAVFFASGDPDGLESTALMIQGQKSLTGDTPPDAEIHENSAGKFAYESPMPDYSLGKQLGPLGGIIAIVAGTLLAFGIVLGVSKLLAARKKAQQAEVNQ